MYSYSVFNEHPSLQTSVCQALQFLEPLQDPVKTDNLSVAWLWAQVDSNHRPRAYQARALTC